MEVRLKKLSLTFLGTEVSLLLLQDFLLWPFPVIVMSWTSDFNGRGLACPRHVHPTSSRHPPVWVAYHEGDALKCAEARVLSRHKLNLSLNPPTTATLFAEQSVKYFFILVIVPLVISRPDNLLMLHKFLGGHRYACKRNRSLTAVLETETRGNFDYSNNISIIIEMYLPIY